MLDSVGYYEHPKIN